ncbi:MAG: aldo/keto reductase [Actinobacteria bacterium]|nr:aldo/keto reductase [Actinomycetota bacterium]
MLAFGTAPLATQFWGNDEATAVEAAVAALRSGITWFDTAPLYGSGEAEERLGVALRECPPPAEVVIATKVGRPVVETPEGRSSTFDYSRSGTIASLEASLGRLGRDRVDIVHVHDPEDHLPQVIDECIPALVELRGQGLIGAVSVGTMVCDTALRLLRESALDMVMIANRLTLLDHSALDELVPECSARNVPLVAAAVFNSGLLASQRPGVWFDYAPADAELVERARAIGRVCESYGVPLRAAALQYPLRWAPVRAVVAGMATADQVTDNIASMAVAVPDELWAELDERG